MLPPWMLAEGTGGGTGGTALVLPSLLLSVPDGGPLPAGLTVTRATHKLQEYPAGTVTDEANNVASLESGGLTIEAAHTNLLLSSAGIVNWTANSVTLAAAAAAAPDGTTTAASALTIANNGSYIYQPGPSASGSQKYTASMWLRAASNTTVYLTIKDASTTYFTTTCAVTTTWTRFTLTCTPSAGTFYVLLGNKESGSPIPLTTFYFWGGQLVAKAYAQSAVATVNTSATCNQDAVAGSAGQIAALPVATGRAVVTFTPEWATATSPTTAALLDTRSAGPDNGFALTVASNKLTWIGEAGTPLQSAALTWVAGTQYTVMAVWNGTTVTLYRDGASVATGASTQPAGQTALKIGQLYDGSAPLDGHVANVAFFRS